MQGVVGLADPGTSGLSVLGSHPLLTAENLESVMPAEKSDDWLENLQRQGIAQVVQKFVQDKQLWRQTRDLLQRRPFFDGAGRIGNVIANSHKVAGFEITPVRGMGVTAQIERIGLQFSKTIDNTSGGDITLYLFHSSQPKPVRKVTAAVKGDGAFAWAVPNKPLVLPYACHSASDVNAQVIDVNKAEMSYTGTDAGGSWYLVYWQDELPKGLEAVNVSKDWSRDPCGTCNIGSVRDWRELTKYLQISPFMVSVPPDWDRTLWDTAEMMYTNTQSYGLNCIVSVSCDLTDFIISQKDNFANVIQKQLAYNILRTIAMNPYARVNRNQSNAMRSDILYELDGNTQGRATGLGWELKQAYKALNISTEGIDRICLACANKGVNYSTV